MLEKIIRLKHFDNVIHTNTFVITPCEASYYIADKQIIQI